MISVQTGLLLIVSALILCDAYITYVTYKQTEKDCQNLKYDLESMRVALNMVNQDVNHHKDHINALKTNITTLTDMINSHKHHIDIGTESARKSRRPKKEKR